MRQNANLAKHTPAPTALETLDTGPEQSEVPKDVRLSHDAGTVGGAVKHAVCDADCVPVVEHAPPPTVHVDCA